MTNPNAKNITDRLLQPLQIFGLLPGIRKIPALPPLLHRRQNRAHFSKNGGDILSTYLYDTSTTCCLSGDTVTISGDISLLYLHQQQLKSSSFCQSRMFSQEA